MCVACAAMGLLAAVALLLPGLAGAALPPPAPGPMVIAGPNASAAGYATPLMVVVPGQPLTFVNLDAPLHSVVASEAGSDDPPWCSAFLPGACPRFYTPSIGLASTSPVLGVEGLASGRSYAYFCVEHPWMTGTLVVAPAVP